MSKTDQRINNLIIEQHGFKRVNNSMWRNGNVTLQNGYTHEGENIYERILNTKKAYRACVNGKFYIMIKDIKMLKKLIELIIVPSVDKEPELAINQMKVLNLLVESRETTVCTTNPGEKNIERN